MYVPHYFREERPGVLATAIRSIKLATLVTPSTSGLQISHIPMLLNTDSEDHWVLESHVARGNPHWALCDESTESAAIFQSPQAYISPTWYVSKQEHGKVVPTWTYIAVHAHGHLEAIEDETWLLDHLRALTNENEQGQEHPWSVEDAPDEYIRGLARAIVGLRLPVTRIEGSWKMNQNKSPEDRASVIDELEVAANGLDVATVMRELGTG